MPPTGPSAAMIEAAGRFPETRDRHPRRERRWHEPSTWGSRPYDPKGRIGEAIGLVGRACARPDHPQAAHLYIH